MSESEDGLSGMVRRKQQELLTALREDLLEVPNLRDKFRETRAALMRHEEVREDCRDYEYLERVSQWVRRDLPNGTFDMVCMCCGQRSCHRGCREAGDDASRCSVMNAQGYCKECGCHWTRHHLETFRWELEGRTEKRTRCDMKARHDQAVRDAELCRKQLDTLRQEYDNQRQQVHDQLTRYLGFLDELDKVGMRPKNNVEEAKKKLEALIDVQYQDKPKGWAENVHSYKQQLELVQLLSEIETVKGEEQAWGLIDRWFGKID